jgi:hypothetical protein
MLNCLFYSADWQLLLVVLVEKQRCQYWACMQPWLMEAMMATELDLVAARY